MIRLGFLVFCLLSSIHVYAAKNITVADPSSIQTNPAITSSKEVYWSEFLENCTSRAEIDDQLAHKCGINLSDPQEAWLFMSKIEPIITTKGEFEKTTDYKERFSMSLQKWNGLHVVFKAINYKVKYNPDTETVSISASGSYDKDVMIIPLSWNSRKTGTYDASNSFGATVQVEESSISEKSIKDIDYVDELVNIKFPMSIDEAKNNLDDIEIAYEVELVLRPNQLTNRLDYQDLTYERNKPTLNSPKDKSYYHCFYFVRVNKAIVLNKKNGKVYFVARKYQSKI